jgi:sterol desaturase/sphingolipid hydroxylase (fatty acid hydroxylase superfamily)
MLNFYILFISTFFITSFISHILDSFHKIINIKKIKNDKSIIFNYYIIKRVFLNVFIWSYVSIFFFSYFINMKKKQYSLYDTIKDLFISSFFIDPFFYFFHRLFHNKYLYKFHKVHHEIKNPYGFSSFYMHEIDFMFGNVLPSFLPLIILSSTDITIKIWIFITVANTVLHRPTFKMR